MSHRGSQLRPAEPRWPVVLTVLAVLFLLGALPQRIRLVPIWVPYALGLGQLLPVAAVAFSADQPRWQRVERVVTLLFFVLLLAGTLVSLAYLITHMVRRSTEIHGLELLTSSMGVWISNVLMFALLYWQIDRGGPGERASPDRPRPDWLFPQESAPPEHAPPDWRPTFPDYLFLSFSTATAFSATDVLPLTVRAKMLMMLEAAIALMTIVVVAARAINVLGS